MRGSHARFTLSVHSFSKRTNPTPAKQLLMFEGLPEESFKNAEKADLWIVEYGMGSFVNFSFMRPGN